MKELFKGLFYSRRRRGATSVPAGGEGEEAAVATRARVEETRRMSDVRKVGRSLYVMGLSEVGFHEEGEGDVNVGRDDGGDEGAGAAPNFEAAATTTVAGRRLTCASTRVERSGVVTGEGSSSRTRKKKLVSRWRRVVESSPPTHDSGKYFEAKDAEGIAKESLVGVMRGDGMCPRADTKRMRGQSGNGTGRPDAI